MLVSYKKKRRAAKLLRQAWVKMVARRQLDMTLNEAKTLAAAIQTVYALHEIDKLEAKSVRKTIRRAERANGRHLMIELQDNLALTARSLRFINSVSSTCALV